MSPLQGRRAVSRPRMPRHQTVRSSREGVIRRTRKTGFDDSLIFVGLQIRENTAALQRNEHNSTMEQWTVIRMAIAQNRDLAEFMTGGLHGQGEMDAADQLRLEQFLAEHAWAASTYGIEPNAASFQRGLSN